MKAMLMVNSRTWKFVITLICPFGFGIAKPCCALDCGNVSYLLLYCYFFLIFTLTNALTAIQNTIVIQAKAMMG